MKPLTRALLAAALLAAAAATSAAWAETPFKPGTKIERELTVGGKRLPLAQGTWMVAADGDSGWTNATIGTFGYLRSIILFHITNDRPDAILEVNTNALPTIDGWGMAATCGRSDLILAVIRYRAGWDGSCYFVTHSMLNQTPTSTWQQAQAFARANSWRVPDVLLTAGFRSADRSDVLDVRYHFLPAAFGVRDETPTRWKDSAWMPARLADDPRRQALARAVSDWAVGYTGVVDAALKNRTVSADVVMPDPAKRTPAVDLIAIRMAELNLQHQAGAISNEEFEVQKAALTQHGLGTSSNAADLSVVTAVKALSYRVIVSVSHIFVDYYWTGSYVATGALEVLQITINSAKFYMHELGWAKYHGVPRTDAARTIDFRYITVDM